MKDNQFWQPSLDNAQSSEPLTVEKLQKMKRIPPKGFADENYNDMIDMVIEILFGEKDATDV